MIDPQLPGQWKLYNTSLTVDNSTRAKILVEESPPGVIAVIAGENALPGESTVRQRVLTGGQRIVDGSVASTDGTLRSLLIWLGRVLSRQADMGTASTTSTTTVNRTTGSFIVDGWKVGDTLMLFDAPTAANNGVAAQVVTVTATTLVCNGTPFTNETLTTCRVVRVSQRTRKAIAVNAGNTDSAPAVPLLGGAQDPAAFPMPDTGISLDRDGILAVSVVANVSALPARIDCHAVAALY